MLIEFTVGNFLSFKEKRTFSMEAASIKENENNVFEINGYSLLKGGAIYGANASGKSNLIKAMRAFEKLIMTSPTLKSTDEINVTPFRLSIESENEPSFFEMVFLAQGVYYRYGFEVTRTQVLREWLFHNPKSERMLFIREGDDIDTDKSMKEFELLKKRTKSNTFFLSVLDSFNADHARTITMYFNMSFEATLAVGDFYREFSIIALSGKVKGNTVLEFFKRLNLGFDSFRKDPNAPEHESRNPEKLISGSSAVPILTRHPVYNDDGEFVKFTEFDLDTNESTGSKKIMEILGPIAQVLATGGFFAMDEMDANLHPILTQRIIELFHSPKTNPKNAQLVLSTHDTNLLAYANYRRDQIWFTEKDQFGSTDLYSLAEFKLSDGKKVRNDASFEGQYLEGRYGAIPFIGSIESILENGQ